jgi:chitinase
VRAISGLLDQLDVMDYDFHGPWEATGPTDFQSELYPSANETPANQFSVDQSVTAFLKAGADRRKLLVGDPTTGGYWVYDPTSTNLYVVDDPTEIVQKMHYIKQRGLGGAFYWSLDGDDTAGSLGAAVDLGLQ